MGTLVQPTTKAQYLARSVAFPPKLFSHNDQQSAWQSFAALPGVTDWGGRRGDLLQDGNDKASFTCVNADGKGQGKGQPHTLYRLQVQGMGLTPAFPLSHPLKLAA